MHNDLTIAILAGLGGMIGWGTADFFAKKTIDVIGDLRTLFWGQLLGVLPLLFIFAVNPKVPDLARADPLFLILFGITSALAYLPLYSGFGKGQVSVLSPIFASYSVVVVLLAALLLGETLKASQILAIAVVFVGIILLNTNPREIRGLLKRPGNKLSAGVPDVLFAMVGYSFWLVYLDKFLSGKSWVFLLLIIRIVAAITLYVYSEVKSLTLNVPDRSLWKYLAVIGAFDVGAFASVSYGFSHTSYVGIVAVLSATFSLPTMLLAYLFLKERLQAYQVVAAFIIIAGVVLVSIS